MKNELLERPKFRPYRHYYFGGRPYVQKDSITLLDTSVLETEMIKMKNTRSRKWLLTINNPLEHDMSQQVIMIHLASLQPIYFCMCDETGEEGTYHTHVFIQFKNPMAFNTLKKYFPSAHIDKARGTPQENREYVRKEGKYLNSEKKTTNHIETFTEEGEMQEEKQGKRTDIEDIYAMIKDGASELEILDKHPNYLRNINSYGKVKSLLMKEQANSWRNLEVTYIYGETGSGKTSHVVNKYGYDGCYRVTDYIHPFDDYDGQDVIIFDEFRSSLPLSAMLNYLDGYPVDLPCRYNNKKALYTKVYIISNIPLNRQYKEQPPDYETGKAFERRIKKVLHFTKGKEPEEEKVKFFV